eukprot:6234051-Amphidinium_carterae.4
MARRTSNAESVVEAFHNTSMTPTLRNLQLHLLQRQCVYFTTHNRHHQTVHILPNLIVQLPKEYYRNQPNTLWKSSDASLAPGDGKSHEGVAIFMGRGPKARNLIHWKSGKQALTSLSSRESELVGAVSAATHGIALTLSMAESHQCRPPLILAHDNTAAIFMMRKGPTNPFRTRHISMRANYVFDFFGEWNH